MSGWRGLRRAPPRRSAVSPAPGLRAGRGTLLPADHVRGGATMSWITFWRRGRGRRGDGQAGGPRPRIRLGVEPLEDRAVPASFTAATVPELIGAITAANQSPEADTITLAPGKTFTLTAVNST